MEYLVPIVICGVLPLGIVVAYYISNMYSEKRRSEVLKKALEMNPGIDPAKLADVLGSPRKSPKEILFSRLLKGCTWFLVGLALLIITVCMPGMDSELATIVYIASGILMAVGLSYLIVYFVTRKSVLSESCDKEDDTCNQA